MKLAVKMIGSALIPVSVIVVLFGWLEVHHELRIYDEKMEHDAVLLGQAILVLLQDQSFLERPDRMLDLLREVNELDDGRNVTYVRLNVPASPVARSAVPVSLFADLAEGQTVSLEVTDRRGRQGFATYVPVEAGGGQQGTLEIVQSLEARNAFRHRVIVRTILQASSILVCCGLLAVISGVVMVGRPVSALQEKMARIGAGDLRPHVDLDTRDELSDLSRGMTAMGERLFASRQRAEQERRAKRAAEEAMRHEDRLRTLGTLASGVAHELGTPLNVVSGRAAMVESGQLSPEEVAASAAIIREQVGLMTGIIRQLLNYARRQPGTRTPGDLVRSVEEAVDLLEPMARKAGVEIAFETPEGRHRAVVDHAQIHQVLTNLMLNGIQACPGGGVLRVSVGEVMAARPGEDPGAQRPHHVITVEDDGIGIAPEDIEHVFDPFFTRKDVGRGTGLGLSIAQGIVHDHGGWIAVTSTLDEGSRFQVFLPAGDAADAPPREGA